MDNKRIHDLLGFLKKRNEMYYMLQVDPKEKQPLNPWDMGLNRVYEEILQHLLEEDIRRNDGRKFCDKHLDDLVFTFILEEEVDERGCTRLVNKLMCPSCFKENQETKE